MNINSYKFDEYVQKVTAFHGNPAPGVVLGGIMVVTAQSHLPKEGLFDAISETDKCLPDSIQLLTPCKIGNGWVRIMNTGRFSLCLYDKTTGDGVRVFVDPEKVKVFPQINNWYFGVKPKGDRELILKELEESGDKILGVRRVKVDIKSLPDKGGLEYAVCPECKESYLVNGEEKCPACMGKLYFSEL